MSTDERRLKESAQTASEQKNSLAQTSPETRRSCTRPSCTTLLPVHRSHTLDSTFNASSSRRASSSAPATPPKAAPEASFHQLRLRPPHREIYLLQTKVWLLRTRQPYAEGGLAESSKSRCWFPCIGVGSSCAAAIIPVFEVRERGRTRERWRRPGVVSLQLAMVPFPPACEATTHSAHLLRLGPSNVRRRHARARANIVLHCASIRQQQQQQRWRSVTACVARITAASDIRVNNYSAQTSMRHVLRRIVQFRRRKGRLTALPQRRLGLL